MESERNHKITRMPDGQRAPHVFRMSVTPPRPHLLDLDRVDTITTQQYDRSAKDRQRAASWGTPPYFFELTFNSILHVEMRPLSTTVTQPVIRVNGEAFIEIEREDSIQ